MPSNLNPGKAEDRKEMGRIINDIIDMLEGKADGDINTNEDTIKLTDSIIKTAMQKRASDIHIEPLDEDTLLTIYECKRN